MARSEARPRAKLPLRWLKTLLPWAVAILIALQLTWWGGLPSSDLPAFWGGVGAMIAVALLLSLIGRSLLTPRPDTDTALLQGGDRPELNRLLAALLLLAGVSIGIGAFWDEVWHRRYGLPFGRDLLWRPHLLMYFGLASVIATAGVTLLLGLLSPEGLRKRLRAEPAHALLLLLGGFLLYSLPADPLWHIVYGADISAWSLPHLLLAFNFAAITLVAVALLASTLGPPLIWRGLGPIRGRDPFIVLAFALALNLLLQIFTTEWDNLRFIPTAPQGAFWDRPEWLFPALLAGLAALIGTVANRASSRIGAATLTGVVALLFRWAMLRVFDYDGASTDAWLLLLPPLIALDLVSLALARSRPLPWWLGALAVAAGTALGTLPLLPGLMVYPRIEAATLAQMLPALTLVAFGGAWLATRLGAWLAQAFATGVPSGAAPPSRRWLVPGVTVALLATVVWFIATATPPV